MNATVESLEDAPGIPLSFQGPASARVVASFGFWLFLLSDIVMFAAMFAAYAVLSGETAGGLSGADLFDRRHVFIFVGLEVSEFFGMVSRGAGPSRSAFLSSFFMLVGTHGLHVTTGLLWLLVMFAQVRSLGFRPMVTRRLFCFGLFWHALDIVWVGVFTIVYLGAYR